MPYLGLYPHDHHPLLFRVLPPPEVSSSAPPLPPHITRSFIHSDPSFPSKRLELLTAHPATSSLTSSQPTKNSHTLLFIHGGFGSASVFLPFLTYFSLNSTHPYKCYAISLRGHGASWRPGYMEMVFRSGLRDFSADAKLAVGEIMRIEKEKNEEWGEEQLVLVGHSAGGGVAQYLMGAMSVKAGGLVLISSFPASGGWQTYLNWALLDPLFLLRCLFRDLTHSRSPLSSTSLIHQAFFSPSYPLTKVQEFEKGLPEYESLLWPIQMAFRFVDISRIVRSVLGWRNREEKWGGVQERERVLILAGESDRLMDVGLMRRMRDDYMKDLDGEGIGFAVVKGGHHVQNDLWWEECAERIVEFVGQL